MRFLLYLIVSAFPICLSSQQTVGLFQNSAEAFDGYTLFAPTNYQVTYLINNCGAVINSWESDYRPGSSVYLLENGNLVHTARLSSSVFLGGGIGGRVEVFSWEGDLVWEYNFANLELHQHHDIEPMPNGNFLILAWDRKSDAEAIEAGRDPALVNNSEQGFWPELIWEIRPVGTNEIEIVWEWYLWDHLIQDFDATKANYGVLSEHPELLDINLVGNGGLFGGFSDWIHANSIAYNPTLDQILISSRHLDEIYIIDHSISTEEAASSAGNLLYRWGNPGNYDRGTVDDKRLFGQHHAYWIPEGRPDEGKIMLFNNGDGRPEGNFSSIDIIEPPIDVNGMYLLIENQAFGPEELSWTYEEMGFYSPRISGAQRLANGNTLICEGNFGHLFEIDPSNTIVWEYINPVRNTGPVAQGEDIAGNDVFRAFRYAPDYPAFSGRDLIPSDVIEEDSMPNPCDLFVGIEEPEMLWQERVSIRPNPIGDYLILENKTLQNFKLEILDFTGRRIFVSTLAPSEQYISTQTWQPGVYFLRFFDSNTEKYYIQKIVKHD